MTSLLFGYLVARITDVRRHLVEHRDAGYTVEALVVTALLVVLAIGAIGVLSVKVMARAKSLDIEGD